MLSMTGSIVLRINLRSLLQYFISYLQSQPLLLKNGVIINVERIYQCDAHYSDYENLPE